MGLIAGETLGGLAAQLEARAHDTSFDAVEEMCDALEDVAHRHLTALERLVREQR